MRKTRGAALAAAPLFTMLLAFAQTPAAKAPSVPVAHPPAKAPATNVPVPAHQLDQADLTAFFDGILPLQLERSDIAGASVLVMKDGNILLEKGYGYAEVKTKKPVDPASTIFRLASISKLFTWVSIMQLEEQGRLNLDFDVNQYLDFRIRPAFNKPITLRNLMTHTAGFEETLDDIIITNPKQAVSLRDYLIRNQPMRIFPPGEIPAYSNYGVGLASYIVQRVSGEPFEQYVQEHIFTPLGMTHSSFYQPLQKTLADLPSEGYRSNTTKPPVGFEIFNPVGAGGISSSAGDMGRFGQALLNGGDLDGKRILKPETIALMWTPQFRATDQLPPICMGFYQDWRNHLHWIGHEGDLIAFHSLFFVEPTQKIVMFVSYNSGGGGSLPRPEIINFFSDRYFPGAPAVQFLKTPPNELKAIEGTYEATRRDDTTKFKLSNLFSERGASVDKDGVLTIENVKDLRGHAIKWKLIAKDLWQAEDEQERIFAIRDSNNKVVRLAVGFPGVELQRVPWYENQSWVMIALGASFGILVLVVLASLIRTWRRLFQRRRPRPAPQPGTIWLTAAPRLASFIWIALLGTLLGYFIIKGDNLMPPTPEWFKWFVLENFVAMLAIVISTLAVIAGIKSWGRDLRVITRLKFSFVALACAFLSWFAIHWHIIGPTHRI
jgi:CubicO group peptidase (beta-lactamase class C family)/cytochrome b561